MKPELTRLIEDVEGIVNDPRYDRLEKFWRDFYSFKKREIVPIKITNTMAFFSRNLDLNLVDHYFDPVQYLEDSLRIIRFQHEEIQDDRVLGGVVITFGEVFESSLFGAKPVFKEDSDPWMGESIIHTEEDLETLDYPDFYESGVMPQVIDIYETARRLVEGKIPVYFERWDRSPWDIAVHLRGLVELFKDTHHNPEFVHRLLDFITESRIRWEEERTKYLGTQARRGYIYNDGLNAQLISPETYDSFVKPYEDKLADFYPEGIFYYHSCGDITPFMKNIFFRGLRKIQISSVTDFKEAIKILGGRYILQKRLDPVSDLLLFKENELQTKIQEILEIKGSTPIELDPGPVMDVPVIKIKNWLKTVRKTLGTTPLKP